MEGWIKLHRSLLNNKVFCNDRLFKTFAWCLLKANIDTVQWKPANNLRTVTIKPGQFVTSVRNASAELGCAKSTFLRHIEQLEKDGCITVMRDTHFTLISVVNWALYQGDEKNVGQQLGHKQGHKRDSNKDSNRDTNENRNKKNKEREEEKEREEMLSPFGGGSMG